MADRDSHETSRRTVLKGSALGAGALFGAAGLAGTARAATGSTPSPNAAEPVGDQYFLKLEGIPGEAAMKDLKGLIELSDFSWGATRAASDGATTAKKAKEVQIHFDAPASIASPLLMLGTVNGKPIKTGAIYVTDSKGNQFIKGEFSGIVISSYHLSATDTERPSDQGTLSFGKIKFTFNGQNPDGSANVVTMQWDIRSDKTL